MGRNGRYKVEEKGLFFWRTSDKWQGIFLDPVGAVFDSEQEALDFIKKKIARKNYVPPTWKQVWPVKEVK